VVEVSQGEVWWADLPEPAGSGPGFRRPVVIVQGDHLNRSRGLQKDSVANASQIIAVDRAFLAERVAKLPPKNFAQVMSGIDVVLGR